METSKYNVPGLQEYIRNTFTYREVQDEFDVDVLLRNGQKFISGLKPHNSRGKKYYAINITHNNQSYIFKIHHIVLFLQNGYFDIDLNGNHIPVDHLNKNTLDNRLNNLKAGSHSDNMRNINKRVDNTSGKTGVHFHKRDNYWYASWTNPVTRKRESEPFRIKKYGDNAFQMACDYRLMIEETVLIPSGYSDRHGK